MRGAEILRKQAELNRLQAAMQKTANRVQTISHDIRRLEEARHRKLLLGAGKIVDRANLLETFNPDNLYVVLMENRERICGRAWEETF